MRLPHPCSPCKGKIPVQAQAVDRTQLEMSLSQLLTTPPKPPHSPPLPVGRDTSNSCTAKSALRDVPMLLSCSKLPGQEWKHHPGPCSDV